MNQQNWPRNIYPNSQSGVHPQPHSPQFQYPSKSYVKKVKLYLPGKENIRRFSIGVIAPNDRSHASIVNTIVDTKFESLKSKILSFDSSIDFEKYTLKYEDEDKDWVTFSNEEEWREFLTYHPQGTMIKVKICKPKEAKKKNGHCGTKKGGCGKKNLKNDSDKTNPFKIGENDSVLDITKMFSELFPVMKQFTSSAPNRSGNKVVHRNIICDICQKKNIEGTRHKCNDCDDYDVCEECIKIKDNHHDPSHKFNPIVIPTSPFDNILTHIIYENDEKSKREDEPVPQKQETSEKKEETPLKKEEEKDLYDTIMDDILYQEENEIDIPTEEQVEITPSVPLIIPEVVPEVIPEVIPVVPEKVVVEEPKHEERKVNEEDLKKFETHLEILSEMGFKDNQKSIELLKKFNGNLQTVISTYLN